MLKLKLKPTSSLGLQEIECYSVYVSPDLSFISGRTSCYNSLMDGEIVKVVNNKNKFINACKVDCENVKVQGKVKYTIDLPIKTIKKNLNTAYGYDYLNMEEYTKNYVEYNGVYSYEYDGRYIVDGKLYSASGSKVRINTFAYIEDGKVVIDGKEYIADFREGGKPNIVEKRGAEPLNYEIVDYESENWYRETKFKIYKEGNYVLSLDDVLFGDYEYYITYEGENYYFENLYDGDGKYIGYGIRLNDNIYQLPDDSNVEDALYIDIDGDLYNIYSTMVSPTNSGSFLFLATSSQSLDLKAGDTVIAQSNGPIYSRLDVSTDPIDNSEYVVYIDKRYDVKKNIYKYINVSGKDYRLIEEDGDIYADFGGNKIYYRIEGGTAYPTNKIYYFYDNDVKYGLSKTGYSVTISDGVIIGNNTYLVKEDYLGRYIEVSEDLSYNLVVAEKNGSNLYVCYPDIDDETISSESDALIINRYVCDLMVNNKDNYTFIVRNDVFGEKKIYPDTYLYDAVNSTKPFTTADKLNLSIFKINRYSNVQLPIVNNTANSILRDDTIRNDFANAISDKSKTTIVDMEKDIYYPVWKNGDTFEDVRCLRFNMHFRTRQLDNWKVIEDYIEDKQNLYDKDGRLQDFCNWFVTDYEYYKGVQKWESAIGNTSHTLHNASDLVGFLNFAKSEVRNRANKIGRSFLRLSFFSTNNPQTQVLLGTSTIFMDDALLCKKVLSLQPSASAGTFVDIKSYQELSYNGLSEDEKVLSYTDSVGVFTEKQDNRANVSYNFEDNNYLRLSSRMEVYDKHTSVGSSEGFYFYMFREYANNMRPLRIYLKIDFNHAGIGRTIPLMLPRKNMEDGVGEPLYLHNDEDLKELKKGFKLKDIYKQLYIPIDVIFDDKMNKYVYYLPDKLRENESLNVDNDIMEFNLFEVKFKDESVKEDESN